MDRADLVYKLVDELEPVLERYASTGIEIAVLISKANDNVVGYQGTKMGKDFLERNTHFTETFRRFCKENESSTPNILPFVSPKKIELTSVNLDDPSDISIIAEDSSIFSSYDLQYINGENAEKSPMNSSVVWKTKIVPDARLVSSEVLGKKKITRKAKHRCSICPSAFFRRIHRLNIHMHENHAQDLTEQELEAFPLPEDYVKRTFEVRINSKGEQTIEEIKRQKPEKKRIMLYRYYCEVCNLKFKKLGNFNEHRKRKHSLEAVNDLYGKNTDGYQCEFCPKVFASRWNLQRHLDIHLGNKKFTCEECKESFYRREELMKHEAKHKMDPKDLPSNRGKITCYSCNQPIRYKAGDHCNIPWSHDNEKVKINDNTFNCKTCSKQCQTQDEFYAHILEHEGAGKVVMSEHDYISTPNKEEENSQSKKFTEVTEKGDNKDEDGVDIEMEDVVVDSPVKKEKDKAEKEEKVSGNVVKIEENLMVERKPFEKVNYQGAFKCDICDQSFVTRFTLQRHKLLHETRKMSKCKICYKDFSRNDILRKHMKRQHPNSVKAKNMIKCNVCQVACKDDIGLKYHMYRLHNIGKNVIIKCDVCNITFTSLKPLRKHIKKHHENDDMVDEDETLNTSDLDVEGDEEESGSKVKAEREKSKPTTRAKTPKHSVKKETPKPNVKKETPKSNVKQEQKKLIKQEVIEHEDIGTRKRHHSCVACSDDEQHLSRTPSKRNKSTAETTTSTSGKKKSSDEGFEFSITNKSHENYSCNVCHKSFRYHNEFTSHQLLHSSQKVFACAMCSLVFLTPINLKRHQEKHDDDGSFSCQFCSFKTDSLEHLNKHKYNVHKSESKGTVKSNDSRDDKKKKERQNSSASESESKDKKPTSLVCEHCGKKCLTVQALIQHKTVHTPKVTSLKCETCKRSFSSEETLRNHMMEHDSDLYKCKTCDKVFYKEAFLLSHMASHQPPKIQCEHCPIKFRRVFDLNNHIAAKHADIVPSEKTEPSQKCEICGKTFLSLRQLERHINVHLDDNEEKDDKKSKGTPTKKHFCDYCEKGYVRRADLKVHVTRHHPDKLEQHTQELMDQDIEKAVSAIEKSLEEQTPESVEEGVDTSYNGKSQTASNGEKKVINIAENNSMDDDGALSMTCEDGHESQASTNDEDSNIKSSEIDEDHVMEASSTEKVHGDEGLCSNAKMADSIDTGSLSNSNVENDVNVESEENKAISEKADGQKDLEIVQTSKKDSTISPADNIFNKLKQIIDSDDVSSENTESVPSSAVKSILPRHQAATTDDTSIIQQETSQDAASNDISGIPGGGTPTNISDLSPEAQQMVQNVLLHSSDNENGPSTIYVVQSDDGSNQPKVIYLVTDKVT